VPEEARAWFVLDCLFTALAFCDSDCVRASFFAEKLQLERNDPPHPILHHAPQLPLPSHIPHPPLATPTQVHIALPQALPHQPIQVNLGTPLPHMAHPDIYQGTLQLQHHQSTQTLQAHHATQPALVQSVPPQQPQQLVPVAPLPSNSSRVTIISSAGTPTIALVSPEPVAEHFSATAAREAITENGEPGI
jgi:hypothetical protein